MEITIKQTNSLNQVARSEWDQLDINGNPFLRYDFLNGLERFRCLEGHGWEPCHLLVTGEDNLLGAMPLYIRDDSHGEFVFDWGPGRTPMKGPAAGIIPSWYPPSPSPPYAARAFS